MASVFGAQLERELSPYRDEYRRIVNGWISSGTFGATYSAFLVESFHYVKHSCSLMQDAATALRELNPSLAEYFDRHVLEEQGHEQWVLSDLEALGIDRARVETSIPLAETINLIGSQQYVVRYLHPAGLLGYVYLMESTPPSSESLDHLENTVGIPRDAMTFLIRHGELDIEHSRELRQLLATHLHTPNERDATVASAIIGLSNVNRMLLRLRDGNFLHWEPLRVELVARARHESRHAS